MESEPSDALTLVVHELRSPLSFVATAARLLAEESPTPELQARCDVIERSVTRLLRITESILDASGAIHTDAPPRLYHPASVVRALVEDARCLACPVALSVGAVGTGRQAWGNPEAFEALVHSLLNNAFDHSPRQATVTVSVTASEDELSIAIDNDIDPVGRHRGLGLGTLISGSLARAAGAAVQSSTQGGRFNSTVRLALLPPEPAARIPLREPSPAPLRQLRAVGASV